MTETTLETPRVRPSMHALVLDGRLRLGQLPRPAPAVNGVVVRVDACAVSRVDLDLVAGRRAVQVRPAVLGHEFVGTVEEVGERVDPAWRGRRVVARPVLGCRRCASCRDRRTWQCEEGRVGGLGMGLVDGAFADYVGVPVEALIPVPGVLDDEEAVLSYSVAVGLEVLAQVQGAPPQRILVVGDGNMGLLLTLMLHAAGHTVSVIGRHPSRRELLWRSGIGFHALGDSGALDPDEWSRVVGEPFGVVVECSGRSGGLDLAARALRPRGRILMVSDHAGQPGADLRFLVGREAELVGVGGGPLQPAIEFLSTRVVDVLPLIDAKYPLDDGVSAVERAGQRGTLRTMLVRVPRERRV
ncbi:MAG TPA: alcohol dehydrogenase catalytic domain-containing protein [Candidatus Krumholzibacteria bacterium]|nr:alcohol dehydrogenase catalytic domain-containing protein [Candidatus Krumholzibacteria bacterium]